MLPPPTETTAKKLSKIPRTKGRSVKNGIEFGNLVNGVKVNRNEEMSSYDVTTLYPSVPVDYALALLLVWLTGNNVRRELADTYVDLARLCMKQYVFQFRVKYYIQFEGACIGNALSSFIAEIFMCGFETSIENHSTFPRFYVNYMDDIFAIQNGRLFNIA